MAERSRQPFRHLDPTAIPGAVMTMTLHMVESRVALLGDLARCGTAAEANTVMTKWFERRVTEFSEDQARIASAVIESFAAAATGAIEAMTSVAAPSDAAARKDTGAT